MALNHSVILLLAGGLLASSCKKEEKVATAAIETTTGTMEAMQAGRFASPPDTTAPPELTAFFTTAGSRLGTVHLALTYPDVHDYAKIEIYRKAGASAPLACKDGTLALTITDFTVSEFADADLIPGAEYSYLACLYDEADNTKAMAAAHSARANAKQRIFVSSTAYDGNLAASFQEVDFADGLEGADARCQWHADQAELSGKWQAVLSSETRSAASRLPVYNGVYLLNGTKVASSSRDMWDGELYIAVDTDEHGVVVDELVWSGSSSSGTISTSNTCESWSSTTVYGMVGASATTPNDSAADWLSDTSQSCTQTARLYCLETDNAVYAAPTLTLTASDTEGTVEVKVDYSDLGGTSLVKLMRQAGSSFVNYNCDVTSGMGSSFRYEVLKTYNGDDILLNDDTVTDVIDLDNNSTFAGEHGHYVYYACAYDAFGNLRQTSVSTSTEQGDDYLRAFISDTAYDGAALSLAVANTACTTSATAAGLTGTFKALLGDETTTATVNINTGSPAAKYIFDLAGNYAGRYTGSGYHDFAGMGPRTTASGTIVTDQTYVWTGATGSGSYTNACESSGTAWNTNASGSYAPAGMITPIPSQSYTFRVYGNCANQYRVWCIEAN